MAKARSEALLDGAVEPQMRAKAALLLEIALVGVFAAAVGVQVFGPYFVGLANNGDFEKVSDIVQVRPPQGWDALYWDWAVRDYVRNTPRWESGLRSSETAISRLALGISRLAGQGDRFDVRFLGGIHAGLLIAAFWVGVRVLRPAGPFVQTAVGLLAAWLLSDVYLVAYLNTFYTDTAAALGLLLTAVMAVRLLSGTRPAIAELAVFTAAALVWTCSKSQHALWAWPAAIVPLRVLKRRTDFRYQKAAVFSIVAIVLSSLWCVRATPKYYAGSALSKLIFTTLIPESPQPERAAAEFGITPEEVKYVGTRATLRDGSPLLNLEWLERFAGRVGYGDVALFYIRHREHAVARLLASYSHWGWRLRPEYLGNFLPGEGPPRARTGRFASWSDLRSAAIRDALWHVPLWYLLTGAVCALILGRAGSRGWRSAAGVCLALVVIGALEFGVANLADSYETDRHLFLFHVITDVTVLFATAAGAALLTQGAQRLATRALRRDALAT